MVAAVSAPVLRFARIVANQVHECAPDLSIHEIAVGELREAVEEMAELYEALRVCVNICSKALQEPMNLKGESPYDIAMRAMAKARGES